MASRPTPWVLGALLLLSCGDDGAPSPGSSDSTTTGTTGPASTTTSSGTSTGPATTSTGPSTSSGDVDSSGSSSTGPADGSSSSESSSSSGGQTGDDVGCADGEREALIDMRTHPDIAACGGAWMFPGVLVNTPMCDRMAGDDGAIPDGRGCSIEDLCSEGWQLCEDQAAVMNAGLANCDEIFWDGAFFATGQSGDGSNTCEPLGLNDVFGCGDLGYTMIQACAPLNRSTGNLCADLPAPPWSCGPSDDSEADQLVKSAPQFGGALCCRARG